VPRIGLKQLLCINSALLAIAVFNGSAAPDLSQKSAVPAKPVPKPQTIVLVTPLGTLRPAFAWTGPKKSDVSYELIICLGMSDYEGFWLPGKTVYYRKGITTTTHTVDKPLLPNTVYVWSVRAHSGNTTSQWAAYGDGDPIIIQRGAHRYNVMFPIKTPGN
jgi:hypothetical protein